MTLWMSYISFAILLLISKYAILDAYLARCPSFWHPESSGTGLSHHLPFPNFCLPFPSSQFPCIHIPTWHAPSPPPAKKSCSVFMKKEGLGHLFKAACCGALTPASCQRRCCPPHTESHAQDSKRGAAPEWSPDPLLSWSVTFRHVLSSHLHYHHTGEKMAALSSQTWCRWSTVMHTQCLHVSMEHIEQREVRTVAGT